MQDLFGVVHLDSAPLPGTPLQRILGIDVAADVIPALIRSITKEAR